MKAHFRYFALGSSLLATLLLAACTTPPLDAQADGDAPSVPPETGIFRSNDPVDPAPGERYAVPYSREYDSYGPRNPYGWR